MNTYVVIGASKGIGLSTAMQLAQHHQVIATYNSNTHVLPLPNITWVPLNILDADINWSFIPSAINGLVYCPGAILLKPFARIPVTDFEADYKLQVIGAVKAMQACLPALKAGGNSSIVLFSTVAVQTGFNFHSVVSASKGAIEGITKALAAELAPSIRVNAIAPSITNTPLAAALLNTPEKVEANAQRHPLKFLPEPSQVAATAAWLLSEQANIITGQVIHADAGIGSLK
jgi:NAD(P)-dependent dehydrogenase (short-subunit alcohol dehydrogenase family)